MIVRIEDKLKDKVDRLARAEGKNTSRLVRELLAEYVARRDPAAYIDDLWKRIGTRLRSRRTTPADIARAIREVRKRR